jgi:hypothetical protein
MPNLDPWVNQSNNDYEDIATKTINAKKGFILARILPIMNVNKKL